MSALAIKGRFASKLFSNQGSISVVYIKANYASDSRINPAAYKRGTGGRSSFSGIVATVFGCSGFVGRSVCNKLGKIGTQLILPYRSDFYDVQRLKLVGDLGQVLFHTFDIRDSESIERAIKYSNVVINLIGRDYETKNFSYDDVNHKGAETIAAACRKMGVERLIHLSYLNSECPAKAVVMPGGVSKWKESKFRGEMAVREQFPDATIIKASDIYGSEDKFINAFASPWRRQGKMMPLYKKGLATEKQPVFVGDVGQAIVNCVNDDDTKGMVYQAVGPRRYQLAEMVDWFHLLMRKDEAWGYRRYDLSMDPTYAMKIKLTELVSPAWPLGYLHWEQIERESTTDVVKKGVPTLEDLGVKLTNLEDQAPWELRPHRAYLYYDDKVGEFPTPPPPKTVNIA